jgi:hypothetical protein
MSKIKFLFHIISFSFIKPGFSDAGGKVIDNKTEDSLYPLKFACNVQREGEKCILTIIRLLVLLIALIVINFMEITLFIF